MRSRRRCGRSIEGSTAQTFPHSPLAELEPTSSGWRARCGEHVIEAGRGGPRRRRPLLSRGRGARRALHEPSRRDRRGDADRARPRRRGPRPRRAPVPPERRRLAREHAGLLHPRDHARLRRRPPERRPRGVHGLPGAARRGLAGDRRRGREAAAGSRRRTAGPQSGSTRRASPRRTRRSRSRTCCAATARGGHRPARASRSSRIPVLHYQNGGLVDRRARRDDGRGPLRLRRDRRRHARAQPDDGQLAPRVLRLRPARRAGPRPRRRPRERRRDRHPEGRRGCRRVPLRLGAQGHPAGSPRRASATRASARPRRPGSACSTRSSATSRSRTTRRRSSARTPASPSTTAASASTSRSIRRGSTRRSTTAPSARRSSIRCARTPCTR